eukprot:4553949-Prymnesium_polylepis.1
MGLAPAAPANGLSPRAAAAGPDGKAGRSRAADTPLSQHRTAAADTAERRLQGQPSASRPGQPADCREVVSLRGLWVGAAT